MNVSGSSCSPACERWSKTTNSLPEIPLLSGSANRVEQTSGRRGADLASHRPRQLGPLQPFVAGEKVAPARTSTAATIAAAPTPASAQWNPPGSTISTVEPTGPEPTSAGSFRRAFSCRMIRCAGESCLASSVGNATAAATAVHGDFLDSWPPLGQSLAPRWPIVGALPPPCAKRGRTEQPPGERSGQ